MKNYYLKIPINVLNAIQNNQNYTIKQTIQNPLKSNKIAKFMQSKISYQNAKLKEFYFDTIGKINPLFYEKLKIQINDLDLNDKNKKSIYAKILTYGIL